MSWLKAAFSKAAEAGGKNLGPNLTKTVKNYAGSVYQQAGQAVAGGAKLMQDRLSGRNLNNFKNAVRRLDEVALNARGEERKQALARWLGALKDIDKEIKNPSKRTDSLSVQSDGLASPRTAHEEETALSPRRASMVLFFDSDTGGDPLNFRDVFLRSNAVENIVTSLILEAPVEEEVSMLLELFGLCLTGGQELHHAIVSSIQDLSKPMSSYVDEVLIKKEELLQMARDAVSGLKLNPEVERLDAEIVMLEDQIKGKQGLLGLKGESFRIQLPTGLEPYTPEDIIQLQVHLRQCLQKKSATLQGGDGPTERTSKVDKLKDLTVRLKDSSREIQEKLVENRLQKQEAINYRATKAQEVSEVEKVVAGEVHELDMRRQQLEAELKEVKAALAAATSRHIHTQEEKEQFDEASSNVVAHLSMKEEELSHSITARAAEESVVTTWMNFLEDTWVLQSASVEQTTKDTKNAWEGSKQQFLQISAVNLAYREEEANILLKRLKFFAEELEILRQKKATVADEGLIENTVKTMRKTQTSYLETEVQMEKMLKVVKQLKDEFQEYQSGQDEQKNEAETKLEQAFESIAVLRDEFEALQRPEIEKVEKKAIHQGRAMFEKARAQVMETSDKLRAVASKHDNAKEQSSEVILKDDKTSLENEEKSIESLSIEDSMELKDGDEMALGETEGWEFDALEEDVSTDNSS